MKTKLIVMLIVLLALGGALFYMQSLIPQSMSAAERTAPPQKTFAPFPDVIFKTPEGHDLRLTDLQEKVVLVHFWAAWCAVCYTEFPDIVKYVANSHGRVALLSVSLDDDYAESEKALKKIATRNHLSLRAPNLYWVWDKDKNLSLKTFNTVKVPETIIVDEKRQMVDKVIGAGPWGEAQSQQNQ